MFLNHIIWCNCGISKNAIRADVLLCESSDILGHIAIQLVEPASRKTNKKITYDGLGISQENV